MTDSSFLDTGVVLGYCFTLDKHSTKCTSYLDGNSKTLYTSPNVESEYQNRKIGLNSELSTDILEHRSSLMDSNQVNGILNSVDIRKIREDILDSSLGAYNSLYWWYTKEVTGGVTKDDLGERLKKMAREMDTRAAQKKAQLEKDWTVWGASDSYTDLHEALSKIPLDDRDICIDAHDAADEFGLQMELATTNPNHLKRNGTEDLIKAETALKSVVDLSN